MRSLRLAVAIVATFNWACVHRPGYRQLDDGEIKRLGLVGTLYDVPLCPIEVRNGVSVVSGPCERVTCEPSDTVDAVSSERAAAEAVDAVSSEPAAAFAGGKPKVKCHARPADQR
jgi:hypothetical protein